jgi:hypothetical protein
MSTRIRIVDERSYHVLQTLFKIENGNFRLSLVLYKQSKITNSTLHS